jgi:hypothetical protein
VDLQIDALDKKAKYLEKQVRFHSFVFFSSYLSFLSSSSSSSSSSSLHWLLWLSSQVSEDEKNLNEVVMSIYSKQGTLPGGK